MTRAAPAKTDERARERIGAPSDQVFTATAATIRCLWCRRPVRPSAKNVAGFTYDLWRVSLPAHRGWASVCRPCAVELVRKGRPVLGAR